ncbi:RNA-directed DNA polymerase [Vibrio parahaemolyticus]|nr:RNA-directed DNA polymerase [Vibrio parahaemolyticus]
MNLITKLAKELETSEPNVLSTVASGPLKYKVYSIPKRTRGRRIIAHPSRELKQVQKAFLALYQFPIHSSAMAYKKGVSIKENAECHRLNKYLLKMDFENFFNSITPLLFWKVWSLNYPEPTFLEKRVIENILFWAPSISERDNLILSVGAPSSPTISNFCLYQFDLIITKYCDDNEITYTRYADDITFSCNTPKGLSKIPKAVRKTLKNLYGTQIEINNQKTVFSSQAHNKHVTGITITPDGKLSIGRERKRYIKHLVHQYTLGALEQEDINHLRGLLSFAKHIEVSFFNSLITKYSAGVMLQITRGNNEKNF